MRKLFSTEATHRLIAVEGSGGEVHRYDLQSVKDIRVSSSVITVVPKVGPAVHGVSGAAFELFETVPGVGTRSVVDYPSVQYLQVGDVRLHSLRRR